MLFHPIGQMVFEHIENKNVIVFKIFLSNGAIKRNCTEEMMIFCDHNLQRIMPVIGLIYLLIIFHFHTRLITDNIRLPINQRFPAEHNPSAVIQFLIFFR